MLKPIVSVVMVTFNHEKYIREAIEGVLVQECDFEVELIVANDCSSDATDAIMEDILKNHPRSHWIKYINHIENKGMMPNFVWALNQCKGKYIALCEGDDYWTDPLKLQKQVDFLERNPDYNICFHSVQIFNQEENKFNIDTITRKVPETTNIEDLARGNFMHTPSIVLRNNFIIPKWYLKAKLGDWTLYMLAIKDQKIYKFNEVMGVYRVHNQGVWAKNTQEYRNELTRENVELILKNFKSNHKVKNILKGRLGMEIKKKSFFVRFLKKIKNRLKQ